jgi:hypothetical protein
MKRSTRPDINLATDTPDLTSVSTVVSMLRPTAFFHFLTAV